MLVNKQKTLLSNKLIPSATASGSCQSSLDPYDLSSDGAARHMTTARLHSNSPPQAPNNSV